MGAGYSDTRCHQYAVGGGEGREDLEQDKEEGYDEHEPSQFDFRCQQHKREREEHDHPRIDRDEHAGVRLGQVELRRNIGEEPDGNELGSVEDERGESEPDEGNPMFRCHTL